MKNKTKNIIIAVLGTLLALVLIVAGTAGAASRTKRAGSDVASHNNEVTYETTVAGMYNNSGAAAVECVDVYTGDDYYDEYYDYDGEYYELNDTSSTSLSDISVNQSISENVATSSRKLIRNMSLVIEAEDFAAVDARVRQQTAAMGGYFESSNVSGTGTNYNYRTGYYVIRIPAASLDAFVESIGTGCTIVSSSESTVDVTLDYVDTEAMISSLRVEQDVLTEMLSEAEDLDTVLVLQQRLTEIRYEIEGYESHLRTVDNSVDYSTLTLTVNEVVEETVQEETREYTFGDKLRISWEESLKNIEENAKELLIDLVYALPSLIILAIISVVVFVIVMVIIKGNKRRKKARAAAQASVKAPESTPENKG